MSASQLLRRGLIAAAAIAMVTIAAVWAATPGAAARVSVGHSQSGTCPQGDGVVRTLRIRYNNQPTVNAHRHDAIRVVAHFPGARAGQATPVTHKNAVCKLGGRRVDRNTTITRWRAVEDRNVEFSATSYSGGNALPAHVGWVRIRR